MAVAVDNQLEQAIDLVLGAAGDVGRVDDAGLASMIGACGRVRSWVAAAEAACLGEVRRRKGDAAAVAAAEQRASSRRAAAAVRRSKLIDALPGVGDALASGTIDTDHVDAFGSVRSEHRDALATEAPMLLEHASKTDADAFRQRLRRWQLDRERASGESELDRQRKNRKGSVSTRADDGMGIFHFELDPIAAARVSAALAQRAEKLWRIDNKTVDNPGQRAADQGAADQGRVDQGGRSKRRSPAQRLADAFEDLTCAAGSTGDAGVADNRDDGDDGVDTSIMIVADVDTLRDGLDGKCELLNGTPLPVDEVRKLALTAKLLPAIFNSAGQPLWVGRGARLPNSAQRAAIAVRDRGCSVPGCSTPVGWCQIHHILWWSHGGPTDLDNLTTVCSRHHHMIHEDHWHISRSTDGSVTWRGPP